MLLTRGCIILFSTKSVMLSAYERMCVVSFSAWGMSFVNNMNSVGEIAEPWETPA